MPILHTINKSPSNSAVWQKMLLLLSKGDSLILIEDACYACTQIKPAQQLNKLIDQHSIQIYVLAPDSLARGLTTPTPWREINYQDFVSLVVETEKTISWCA